MNRLRVVVTDKEEINNNSFKSTIPGNMSGKTGVYKYARGSL